jgi:hypothetical protein
VNVALVQIAFMFLPNDGRSCGSCQFYLRRSFGVIQLQTLVDPILFSRHSHIYLCPGVLKIYRSYGSCRDVPDQGEEGDYHPTPESLLIICGLMRRRPSITSLKVTSAFKIEIYNVLAQETSTAKKACHSYTPVEDPLFTSKNTSIKFGYLCFELQI